MENFRSIEFSVNIAGALGTHNYEYFYIINIYCLAESTFLILYAARTVKALLQNSTAFSMQLL